MLREVVRFEPLCRHVLFSPEFIKMFDYMQLPTFEIASDAAASFREMLTRHKAGIVSTLFVREIRVFAVHSYLRRRA